MWIKEFIKNHIGTFAGVKESDIKTREERELWEKQRQIDKDMCSLERKEFERKYANENPNILFELSKMIKERKEREKNS